MDIQALKLDLVAKILETEKTSVLLQIRNIFQLGGSADWWDQLPIEVQESILEGMDDVKKGNVIPHEQVLQEAKQKYGF